MTQKERLNLLFEIIIEDDFYRVEGARDIVEKQDLPYLIKHYNTLNNWEEKHNLIQIIQDHYHENMRPIMLDYLRAPYKDSGDTVELTKAAALSILAQDYSKFDDYYQNIDLLYTDVNKMLSEHDLKLETSQIDT